MPKNKFFFIVFEGVEGTGKSYQINKLFNNLKKKKYKVFKTREPGGSNSGEKIRNLIFPKNSDKFHQLTDYYLMLASRNELIVNIISKAKKDKSIVLCDRFNDSTHAYQVVGNGINHKLNLHNHRYIMKSLKPNITIVLTSDYKTITSRIKNRKNKNKFDKLKLNFYKKIQDAFIKLAKNKKNYFIFDSSETNNDLEKKILKLISKKIR